MNFELSHDDASLLLEYLGRELDHLETELIHTDQREFGRGCRAAAGNSCAAQRAGAGLAVRAARVGAALRISPSAPRPAPRRSPSSAWAWRSRCAGTAGSRSARTAS